jgi:hypothetical protein
VKTCIPASALCVMTCLVVSAMMLTFASSAGDKMKPEEFVAKHLESIGPAEARNSVQSHVIAGTVVATVRSPGTAQFNGQAVMASESNKAVIGFGFESANYSQERFGFDGKSVTVGYSRPGVRSNLGDFIQTHNVILKEGLIGGALSSAWPLRNLAERKAKLEYRGTKKIAGKQMHELKYYPRGSADLQIVLFFDLETFQHLRTEYTRVITSQLGATVDTSAIQRTSRYKMIEEFSDFKKESGLNLPHSYKIGLELETRGATYSGTWDLTLSQFAFNQPIQPASFNVAPQ